MPRQALFNFEPEHQLVDKKKRAKLQKHVASLQTKNGQLTLSTTYIRDNGLDGKYIKLYADTSKKVIGWKFLTEEHHLADLKGYHLLKIRESKCGKYTVEKCTVAVGKLVNALGLTEKSYLQMPIQKYNGAMFETDIHFIELKK